MRAEVEAFWAAYKSVHPDGPEEPSAVFHFCDNEVDADICADLVLSGQKRATAASLAELEAGGDTVPQCGDLSIVTRWSGEPVAIIRTIKVTVRKYCDIDAEFAALEGEGDGSLEWWRTAHEAYYRRVLAGTGTDFSGDLMIACEEFELVFRR